MTGSVRRLRNSQSLRASLSAHFAVPRRRVDSPALPWSALPMRSQRSLELAAVVGTPARADGRDVLVRLQKTVNLRDPPAAALNSPNETRKWFSRASDSAVASMSSIVSRRPPDRPWQRWEKTGARVEDKAKSICFQQRRDITGSSLRCNSRLPEIANFRHRG